MPHAARPSSARRTAATLPRRCTRSPHLHRERRRALPLIPSRCPPASPSTPTPPNPASAGVPFPVIPICWFVWVFARPSLPRPSPPWPSPSRAAVWVFARPSPPRRSQLLPTPSAFDSAALAAATALALAISLI
ncbi:hypothetical protein C2845_PM01G42340 [Panicum miliaceum]|uniref:Uncharacterized protein n=1 Tax=Panicum miliaceum TaxID=4540 RepID=A0A3L6TK76_PANMI|nr:hypothetical protein C2845_PM01G42340 [Panicum miliaceum]